MVRLASLSLLLSTCSCASTPSASDPAAPSSTGDDATKVAAARAQLDELGSAWSSYSFAVGRCPQSVDDLVHPPVGAPLIAAAPVDPWGQPIAFMPASEENSTPQLVSAGPDGELLTSDDLKTRASCSEP